MACVLQEACTAYTLRRPSRVHLLLDFGSVRVAHLLCCFFLSQSSCGLMSIPIKIICPHLLPIFYKLFASRRTRCLTGKQPLENREQMWRSNINYIGVLRAQCCKCVCIVHSSVFSYVYLVHAYHMALIT